MRKYIRLEGDYFEEETKFEIEINCLWHQSCYFSDTPYIYLENLVWHMVTYLWVILYLQVLKAWQL